VDADLGSANLHTYLGIKSPSHTLLDALEGKAAVADVLLPTPEPGLKLLSCAGDILGLANPDSERKDKIINFISSLQADYILVDLGAGTSYNVLDFFNISHEGIIIVAPDPASMQNAYAFIKSAIYRRIERDFNGNPVVADALDRCRTCEAVSRPRTMMEFFELLCTTDPLVAERVALLVESYRPLMIINTASSAQDQRVAEILQSASKRFLNVDIRFCGLIVSDPAVRRATQRLELLDFSDRPGLAAKQIQQTVSCLLNYSDSDSPSSARHAANPLPATPTMGLNDNVDFMGKQFHIQTEDLGYTGRSITTQVFCDGKVVLSAKSEYPVNLESQASRGEITDLMRRQHFNVIRELESKKVHILHSS
jgi:flagellar biosynthesis protein FlhG